MTETTQTLEQSIVEINYTGLFLALNYAQQWAEADKDSLIETKQILLDFEGSIKDLENRPLPAEVLIIQKAKSLLKAMKIEHQAWFGKDACNIVDFPTPSSDDDGAPTTPEVA